jgi:predicted ATP-dependent endonuclease of OLD family
VNIFFGLNGSGKTSLIKILHSAMSGDASILENVPFTDASVRIYSLNYKKIFTRKIVREKRPTVKSKVPFPPEFESRVEFETFARQHIKAQDSLLWKETPKIKTKEELTSWQHRYLPTARLHVSDDPFLRSTLSRFGDVLTEEILDEYFAESVRSLWSGYSSQLLRDVRDSQERGLASILRAVLSPSVGKRTRKRVNFNKAYESMKNFLVRQGSPKLLGNVDSFRERYKKDASLRRIVQDIFAIEREIAAAMATRRELQQLIEKLYTGDKHVNFGDNEISVTDIGGSQIGLASLSSGEKHLMRILVETLLAGESTILIDEPELSMHIDWQHDLVRNLGVINPKAQLVLATHSPEVMAEIPDERIFSL